MLCVILNVRSSYSTISQLRGEANAGKIRSPKQRLLAKLARSNLQIRNCSLHIPCEISQMSRPLGLATFSYASQCWNLKFVKLQVTSRHSKSTCKKMHAGIYLSSPLVESRPRPILTAITLLNNAQERVWSVTALTWMFYGKKTRASTVEYPYGKISESSINFVFFELSLPVAFAIIMTSAKNTLRTQKPAVCQYQYRKTTNTVHVFSSETLSPESLP